MMSDDMSDMSDESDDDDDSMMSPEMKNKVGAVPGLIGATVGGPGRKSGKRPNGPAVNK
jgi:hypothetical protein